MKVLHTSDWHLGSTLHGRKRYDEYEQFLDWLIQQIGEEHIDVLLIAGDVFDNSTPSNHAQSLYYHFLHRVAAIPCLQVVVTGGNHDSPSLLDAPKDLLRQLRIHVIGSITSDISEEIIILRAEDSQSLIVCAVPYLRDRDIRMTEPGESIEDKAKKIREGIMEHYRQVWVAAESIRQESDSSIPIIAMGHLFLESCQTNRDDGVRELYIGNIAGIDANTVVHGFDYFALGHLHGHTKVGGNQWCRYCGSPLPMGFAEAGKEKKIVIIDFQGNDKSIKEIDIPCFRKLKRIQGDLPSIEAEIQDLCRKGQNVWIEVLVESEFNASLIQIRLRELVKDSSVEILKIMNTQLFERALHAMEEGETLEDLDETEVFSRCLDMNEISARERKDLLNLYQEILAAIQEEDHFAE